MLTVSGERHDCCLLTMYPARLKNPSIYSIFSDVSLIEFYRLIQWLIVKLPIRLLLLILYCCCCCCYDDW